MAFAACRHNQKRGNPRFLTCTGAAFRKIVRAEVGGVNSLSAVSGKGQLMNKNDLIAAVAEATGMSKAGAGQAVDATFDAITSSLKSGTEVKIIGFGNFSVAKRAASHRPQSAHRRDHQDRRVEDAEVQGRQGPQGRGQPLIRPATRGLAAGPAIRGAGAPASSRELRRTPIGSTPCVRTACRLSRYSRAVSSVGRAPRLHRGCREFEPLTAHQLGAIWRQLMTSRVPLVLIPGLNCSAQILAARLWICGRGDRSSLRTTPGV